MTAAATIRLATAADSQAVAAIYAPHVTASATSFEVEAPDGAEIAHRIEETQRTHAWLVWQDAGGIGGYAYGSKHRARAAYQWSAEVSVYVGERFRRRRIGQALYTSLFHVLAAQHFVTAYAGITLPNVASVALHESLGFVPVGVYRHIGFKMGAWHDVGWWQRPLQPRPSSPAPPRPIAELAAGELTALLATGVPVARPAADRV